MKQHLIHVALAAIVLAICCPLVIANQMEKQPMQATQKHEFKSAQDYIELFRNGGERYDGRLPGLMIGTQPDPQAMRALGEVLATDTRDVRRKIISLLLKIDLLSHPAARDLRNPEVIDLLVGPGFAKADAARSGAMDMLRNRATIATLSRYGDVFLKALKEEPGSDALYLIAKVKPKGAREEVERLSRLPEWKDKREIRIALAALGDTKIENEYIAEAKKEEDAGDVGGLLASLGALVEIGTQRSLQAVCLRMRSPLFLDTAGIDKRSIRLSVMDILGYAFPEGAEMLSSSNVMKDEDYIRAEQFCVQATGVQYDKPRPPFFTIMGYPG